MNYEQVLKTLGVKNTLDYLYQPMPDKVLAILNAPDDPWYDYIAKTAGKIGSWFYETFDYFGITDQLKILWRGVQNIFNTVKDIFEKVTNIAVSYSKYFFNKLWSDLDTIIDYVSYSFKRFMADPWGFLYDVVQYAVRPLIQGIKTVSISAYDIANTVYGRIKDWLSSTLNSIYSNISYLTSYIANNILETISNIYSYIRNLPSSISNYISYYASLLYDKIKTTFNDTINTVTVYIDQVRHFFNYTLGSVADAIYKTINNFINSLWNIFLNFVNSAAQYINDKVLKPLWDAMKGVGQWVADIFAQLWQEILKAADKLAPSAPEKGESLSASAAKLLGIAAAGFGALTGVSMAVSWLSKHHMGHLSAILYDMSSYKLISNALIGGLVTAAYAQPLKYFYNAKFRPYLPSWGEVMEALGRSKISDELFKFFLKYHGVPDKYIPIYKALAAKPISAFMIRYIAEAEIVDPDGIFKICMDSGYSVEHAGYMAYAMSWGATSSYRKKVESVIQLCYKEGFITRERMIDEINKIRKTVEVPVSYRTVDGYVYKATIKVPIPQRTLISLAAEWQSFYDSTYDKIAALKTAYSKENITEEEFRNKLRDLIVIPERLEDIVEREKAKKAGKTEPEKGKTLRDELKTVLRRCYKEGFITYEKLADEVKKANQVVDEETLILARANWEAFYDDTYDLVKIYKENLENGIIDEATFRRDLIDLGLRPSKVELMIKYDRAKKTGRLPKK